MRIAITTPTGKIGRKLVDQLFDRGGHQLTLLTRNRKQVEGYERRGAKVFEGNLEDREYFTRATKNVDALFFVLPMNSHSKKVFEEAETMIGCATYAVKTNEIPRVVFVSSVGAHLEKGVGPIRMLRNAELELGKVAKNFTVLRPVFYMDQFFNWMKPISESGELSLPFAADTRMPMIATRDVANYAADVLLDTKWTGHRVLPLYGPKEYSFAEVAKILGKTLGTEVKPIQVEPAEAARYLLDRGWSEPAVDQNLEMMSAFAHGRLADELPRSKWITRPTTFEEFAKTDFLPVFKGFSKTMATPEL